VIRRR